MSDREAILARLRGAASGFESRPAAPPRESSLAAVEDLEAKFAQTLRSVGGDFVSVEGDLGSAIEDLATRSSAHRLLVDLPGWATGEVGDVADLDLTVVAGELAVAENAAVWVAPATVELRAALFLSQHLAIVVRRASLVSDMHQAYAATDVVAGGYGVFISGPSKTADIEQSLVIGAHGPRSLTVLMTAP